MATEAGRRRVMIARVRPEVAGGRYPAKATLGESVLVEADVYADGHDALACVVRYRHEGSADWSEVRMRPLGNDRWRAEFTPSQLGRYHFTIQAWVDEFETWRRDLAKRVDARQDVAVDLLIGADILEATARRARGANKRRLEAEAAILRGPLTGTAALAALDGDLAHLVGRHPDRTHAATYQRALGIVADPERARFSAWYEMFPRSSGRAAGRHGTFRDVEAQLAYVAELGFDVLYLPPIHPIGRSFRKGKNNAVKAGPRDVGSPWAIGSEEGGHKAVNPGLGTLDDFRGLVRTARERYGIEVALDIAFQCSPDHPYVREHPEWFRRRPDNTIQYAENPPKKYQDIYPFDFETSDWRALWEELKSVFLFWIEQGVTIFRVDNPHTKPFAFWEWLIDEVKREHPEIIFLSEAFTRPRVMYELAMLGFSQSYTYFAWRNTRWELTEYFTELTQTDVRDFFRPNLWPNTPDILTEYLQFGGRPAFIARLVLAATLGANYGIYGPAFELCENEPREPGSEEYRDSEKYQLRAWELDRPDSLRELISRVNSIRRDHRALHSDRSLRFHEIDNEQLIVYSKRTENRDEVLLVAVNLDPHHTQSGWTSLDLEELGLEPDQPFQAHDLLTQARYLWHGAHNYVELDPHSVPAHVLRIRHRARTEREFEYYL